MQGKVSAKADGRGRAQARIKNSKPLIFTLDLATKNIGSVCSDKDLGFEPFGLPFVKKSEQNPPSTFWGRNLKSNLELSFK